MMDVPEGWTAARYLPQYSYRDGKQPCYACSRPLTITAKTAYIRIHGGGRLIVTHEEAEAANASGQWGGAAADCGGQPIGPECLRNYPQVKSYAK